jgi:hypothetical protein
MPWRKAVDPDRIKVLFLIAPVVADTVQGGAGPM